ncbi:MAG TPA: serine/threonine-protein kinase, partial [Polyangiaceae bacterium]
VKAEGTIPNILDANIWHDHAYIAMELLAGVTLTERISQGPIWWRRALFIVDQLATALEAAHALGTIHRDLKPANIILVGQHRACVIDWGIARLRESVEHPHTATLHPVLAASDFDATDVGGSVVAARAPMGAPPLGTPGYIAPEAYDGIAPAPAQDAFALGVVLYEMLTGKLPHKVERPERLSTGLPLSSETMRSYRMALERATQDRAFVPLTERSPGLPSGVVQLVEALLAADPVERPAQLRAAIDRASRFPTGVPSPPYAGLSRLGPERGGLFFGQDDAVAQVLRRLQTDRAALLWGPSGAGKSSVALAGVATHMDRLLFLGADGWKIHAIRPSEARSANVLRLVTGAKPLGDNLGDVIVIDQLEEVVDLAEDARRAFSEAVIALVEGSGPVRLKENVIHPGPLVRILATIRDDLEWRVDREIPALRPLLERRFILKGVDANTARSMIEEPARVAGFSVEKVEDVSRAVAEALSKDAAKLPVVQFALSEWWERRDELQKMLPFVAWSELGGVDGALSFVAERFHSNLDSNGQKRLRSLFLRFFREGRKQPVAEADLDANDLALVKELVALRLVGLRSRKGGAPFYEAEHESLAHNWTLLATWVSEQALDQEFVNELETRATLWDGDGRAGGVLLPPERLEYAKQIGSSLSALARAYVDEAILGVDQRAQAQRARVRRFRQTVLGLGLAAAAFGTSIAFLLLRIHAANHELANLKAAIIAATMEVETRTNALNAERARLDQDAAKLQSQNIALEAQVAKQQTDETTLKGQLDALRVEQKHKAQACRDFLRYLPP